MNPALLGSVPTTTSLLVAERFGKDHKHVMRDIRILTAGGVSSFGLSSYVNSQNKNQPMFEMTRQAFMILVMGFNGEKALKFKQDFVQAFDAMEEELSRPSEPVFDDPIAAAAEAWSKATVTS